MDLTVCKLPLPKEGENSFLRLETEWFSDGFRIIVFCTESVLTGKVTAEEIKSFSQCLAMDIGDYMRETRKALSSHGGSREFTYAIEDGKFLWKKLVDNDADFRIRFGSVLLEEVPPFEMFECMLDAAIDINQQLQGRVQTSEQRRIKLESEKEELFEKLTQYQKEKKEMEETLYNNFMDLLNAKKKRIRTLEKYIDSHHLPPNASTLEKGFTKPSKNIVFDSDSDPDNPESCSMVHSNAKVQKMSDTPLRTFIKDYDEEEPPPKVLSKRRRHTKPKLKPSSAGKRKVSDCKTSGSTLCQLDSSSPQPSTSGYLPTLAVQEAQHYDSETDVDQCTDDETNFKIESLNVMPKPSVSTVIDNLFDDIKKPTPTCVLPKRVRRQPNPKSSETSIPTSNTPAVTNIQPSTHNKPIGNASSNERRRLNTQELLDELIN